MAEVNFVLVEGIHISLRCRACGVMVGVHLCPCFVDGALSISEVVDYSWYCQCGGTNCFKAQVLLSTDVEKSPIVKLRPVELMSAEAKETTE